MVRVGDTALMGKRKQIDTISSRTPPLPRQRLEGAGFFSKNHANSKTFIPHL